MNTRTSFDRRNFWVRTIAGLTGDIAVGLALANACIWVIQSAALGLFLSALAWLITIILGLAVSQHLVRPAVAFVLSDAKLDDSIEAVSSLVLTARYFGVGPSSPLWRELQQGLARFVPRRAAV